MERDTTQALPLTCLCVMPRKKVLDEAFSFSSRMAMIRKRKDIKHDHTLDMSKGGFEIHEAGETRPVASVHHLGAKT